MARDLPEQTFQGRMKMLVELVGGVEKLAQGAHLSSRVISKYLAGESDPSRERLVAMARAGGVSVSWLAAGEGPMKIEFMVEGESDKAIIRHFMKGAVFKEPSVVYMPGNHDVVVNEIVQILEKDLPEAKPFVLKILRGKKQVKEGLVGLGVNSKDEV